MQRCTSDDRISAPRVLHCEQACRRVTKCHVVYEPRAFGFCICMCTIARAPVPAPRAAVQAPSDPVGSTAQHPRWVHGYLTVPEEIIKGLMRRKQQVGQLELLAAASAYYSLSPWLHKRDVIHFIDNTAAASGMAKGYSPVPDSARIIHAFHALNVNLQTNVHFEWVKSEANIANMPTRNKFELLLEIGSKQVTLTSPPMASWRTPDELYNFAQGATGIKQRGGRG